MWSVIAGRNNGQYAGVCGREQCEIVGRDFTQAEWDRFVPGGEPLQSSCL